MTNRVGSQLPLPSELPRQTHIDLSFEELVRRVGAEPPHIFLVEAMPKGRVVWESFEGRRSRRITCYAMHPETYRRAMNVAYSRWSTGQDGIPGAGRAQFVDVPCNGYEIAIPIVDQDAMIVSDIDAPLSASMLPLVWRIRL